MADKRETSIVRRGDTVQIVDLTRDRDNFPADVRAGLMSTPKALHPRYFYDDLGSILFDAICRLPEYYVARAETEILRQSSREIISSSLAHPLRLIELGPGSATKTRLLIDATLQVQSQLTYFPVDIDLQTLSATADSLAAEYPALAITGIAATFEDGLRDLTARLAGTQQPTLVLFLGSTIGNLDHGEQREILRSIRAALRRGDALLLGADLVKSEDVLISAYDDVLGVTAAFNRNLLVRINRELEGTFDLTAFRHEVRYDRQLHRIEMYLVSTKRQRVTIPKAEIAIEFQDGESIHTENSYKFTRGAIEALARDSQFMLARQWVDRGNQVGEHLLIAT